VCAVEDRQRAEVIADCQAIAAGFIVHHEGEATTPVLPRCQQLGAAQIIHLTGDQIEHADHAAAVPASHFDATLGGTAQRRIQRGQTSLQCGQIDGAERRHEASHRRP